jgi:hypothetical protein
VQWGAPAALEAFAADHVGASKFRSLSKDAAERVKVAGVDRRGHLDGDGIAVG